MKKLICLSLILINNACVDQGSSNIDYTIFNQTDKSVKILGFNTRLDVNANGKSEPIVISPNSEFKVTRVTGIENNTGFRFYSIQGVDSVRVIFNNLKIKTFGGINDDTPHDIFTGGDDNKSFITEQDYKNAEDCNGDCE